MKVRCGFASGISAEKIYPISVPISVFALDDDDDIMATLMKYEKEVKTDKEKKKDKKRKPDNGNQGISPSSYQKFC